MPEKDEIPSYQNTSICGDGAEELRRLKVLFELTTSIISITDSEELLNKLSRESVKFFNAEVSIIRLLKDGKLMLAAHTGLEHDIIRERGIGEGLCGRAAETGSTIFFDQSVDHDRFTPMSKMQVGICTPLKIGATLIGSFALLDKKDGSGNIVPFNEDDRITIEGFASVAAIVIEKSIFYENALKQEYEAIEAFQRWPG